MEPKPQKALPLAYQVENTAVLSAVARGIPIICIILGVAGCIYRPVIWTSITSNRAFPTSARVWETVIFLEHLAQIVGGVMCIRGVRAGKAVMLIWAAFELCYQAYYIGSEVYVIALMSKFTWTQVLTLCRYANTAAIYSAFPAVMLLFSARDGFDCFTYNPQRSVE
jgi:hypothetical protein